MECLIFLLTRLIYEIGKIFEIGEIKKKIVNLFSARYRQLKLVEILKTTEKDAFSLLSNDIL